MYDVIVIGGGPAGLQAALTLGRMHRSTLLLDSGAYRNAPADAMHNFLTLDGTDPAALRTAARAEIARYQDVEIRDLTVDRVSGSEGAFTVTLGDGTVEHAARVVLATGVRDLLPDIPGPGSSSGPSSRTARSATGTSSRAAPWCCRPATTRPGWRR